MLKKKTIQVLRVCNKGRTYVSRKITCGSMWAWLYGWANPLLTESLQKPVTNSMDIESHSCGNND